MPVTSRISSAAKTSAVSSWPRAYSLASLVRISTRCLRGVTPALSKWPALGLVSCLALTAPNPSWTAEEPSVSGVRTWVTTQGPAWTTVTGTTRLLASQSWVMPSLVPSRPLTFRSVLMVALLMVLWSSELDFDVDTGRQVQPHQGVDGLGRRVDDVDEPLVGAHLKVLPAVLVLVRRADHAVHVLLRGQRHRAGDLGTRPGDRVNDLARRGVDHLVVVGLQPNADLLSRHSSSFSRTAGMSDPRGRACRPTSRAHNPESYGAGGVSRPKQARAQESRGSASSLRTRVELQARHTPATPSEQPDDSVRRHKPDQIAAILCLPVTGGRAADRSPQCATSPAGIGLVAPYCGDKSPVAPEIARWRGRRPSCHGRGRGRAVEAGRQRGGRCRRHDAGELRGGNHLHRAGRWRFCHLLRPGHRGGDLRGLLRRRSWPGRQAGQLRDSHRSDVRRTANAVRDRARDRCRAGRSGWRAAPLAAVGTPALDRCGEAGPPCGVGGFAVLRSPCSAAAAGGAGHVCR